MDLKEFMNGCEVIVRNFVVGFKYLLGCKFMKLDLDVM